MPVDNILTDISTLGWLFNNCYQDDYGVWRVNLRRPAENGDWFSDWAVGDTFDEALEECMSKLHEAEYYETVKQMFSIQPEEKPVDLKSILSILNLRKPTQIKRRF